MSTQHYFYLDTRLLYCDEPESLLKMLSEAAQAPITVLASPWLYLNRTAESMGAWANAARRSIAYMSEHPEQFIIQETPECYGMDSIRAACVLMGAAHPVTVWSNDVPLSLDIMHHAGANVSLFRIEDGHIISLDSYLQLIRSQFVQAAAKSTLIADSTAWKDVHLAERMEMMGLSDAMQQAGLTCSVTSATLDLLQDTPCRPLLCRLEEKGLLKTIPLPPGVDETAFFKALRMSTEGKQMVLTSPLRCGEYSMPGLLTRTNEMVQFAHLTPKGFLVYLDPERPNEVQKEGRKAPGKLSEHPYQYMRPQAERAVKINDEEDLFALIEKGCNICWPLIAAVKCDNWDLAARLLDDARKASLRLHPEAFVVPARFLANEVVPARAVQIGTVLKGVLPLLEEVSPCAAAADVLRMTAGDAANPTIRQTIQEVLTALPKELSLPATADSEVVKEEPTAESESAGLLNEAVALLSVNREEAVEKAWQAANKNNMLALKFLAEKVNHAAALCAWGRFLIQGGRLNAAGEVDSHGQTVIRPNLEDGFRCLLQSADLGYPNGALQTAECYRRGIGTPVDRKRAEIYYKKAAACKTTGIRHAAFKGLLALDFRVDNMLDVISLSRLASMIQVRPFQIISWLLGEGIFAHPETNLTAEEAWKVVEKFCNKVN